MKYLKPLLAVYGAGIVGTFAWLFFALSGTSACAAGRQVCQTVIGLTGQLALIWPAYWGGRLTGEPVTAPAGRVDLVLVALVVFVATLAIARVHEHFARPVSEEEPADRAPLVMTGEPNRRNQSVSPPA